MGNQGICANDGCAEPVFQVNTTSRVRKLPIVRTYKFCYEHWKRHLFHKRNVGRHVTTGGYIKVPVGTGTQLEHRVVMAEKLGRPLIKGESVHHINGDRADNRPENLELWVSTIRYGQRSSDLICPHCHRPYYEG